MHARFKHGGKYRGSSTQEVARTVAVLVLDDHVAVLLPRGVVAHNVRLLLQHRVRVDLAEHLLPAVRGGWSGVHSARTNRLFAQHAQRLARTATGTHSDWHAQRLTHIRTHG